MNGKQATPMSDLHQRLMDPNIPKTELEHYAVTLLAEQQAVINKVYKIIAHTIPEQTGMFFICGESGLKDQMGLPEVIFVCPAIGLDGVARYAKTSGYTSPDY